MLSTLVDYWSAQATETDFFEIRRSQDEVTFSGNRADDLLRDFGSPLYLYSPNTAVANLTHLREAFEGQWPRRVHIYYSMKANPDLGLCIALAQEGAGADCMTHADLLGAALAGFKGPDITLNGSSKDVKSLRAAAKAGATVNIDSQEDLHWLAAESGEIDGKVRVRIRLKLPADSLSGIEADHLQIPGRLDEYLRARKWGFITTTAIEMVIALQKLSNVELCGFHFHYGRLTRSLDYYGRWAAALAAVVREIGSCTGYYPEELDIGGGWPRSRDPESGTEGPQREPIIAYAEAVCSELLNGLAEVADPPALFLEPGSYISGNACVLLGRVLSVKRDDGRSWLHIDASTTNHMARLDAVREVHVVAPTSHLNRKMTSMYDVVGPICFASRFRSSMRLPEIVRDEPIAILDAGMYAEVLANNFNGLDIPASVNVDPSRPRLLRQRRSGADWYMASLAIDRSAWAAADPVLIAALDTPEDRMPHRCQCYPP